MPAALQPVGFTREETSDKQGGQKDDGCFRSEGGQQLEELGADLGDLWCHHGLAVALREEEGWRDYGRGLYCELVTMSRRRRHNVDTYP